MAPRDKRGILFISRAVVQSYLSALCVHSRLANVLIRFNLDNKFQRGGGTESYVREQTLENQSRQLPESALLSHSPQCLKRQVCYYGNCSKITIIYCCYSIELGSTFLKIANPVAGTLKFILE